MTPQSVFSVLSVIFAVACIGFIIAAIAYFVRKDIRGVLDDLSGKSKQRDIRERSANASASARRPQSATRNKRESSGLPKKTGKKDARLGNVEAGAQAVGSKAKRQHGSSAGESSWGESKSYGELVVKRSRHADQSVALDAAGADDARNASAESESGTKSEFETVRSEVSVGREDALEVVRNHGK